MHRKRKICFILLLELLACAVLPGSTAVAQESVDVVVLQKQSGEGETRRKGEIVSWIGDVISIRSKAGLKEVESQRLVRIKTPRHPGLIEGNRLLEQYRYDAAVEQFEAAIVAEDRPWMQNIICSRMVVACLAKENFGGAAKYFLKVIDDDPRSRFRNLVPLVWTSSRPAKRELGNAEAWLESSEPMIALLGASWLLSDKSNSKAKAKMEFLANDFDPTIAALAQAQLWRLDAVAADEKRLAIRIRQVQAMPENVRYGGWYLIAETQSKLKQSENAMINFMRIPVNDPQHGSIAAAALYQTAWLLDNTNRNGQAQTLRGELKEKFGDTVWAN